MCCRVACQATGQIRINTVFMTGQVGTCESDASHGVPGQGKLESFVQTALTDATMPSVGLSLVAAFAAQGKFLVVADRGVNCAASARL